MLDMKQAVNVAIQHATNLYDDNNLPNLLLEEIVKQDNVWLVTLGFTRKTETTGLSMITNNKFERSYKEFTIDCENGNLVSMRVKQIN